jgi:carbonic anhydrase/acetyltransferase-like protein (isoleucine patch superfamily)
MAPLILPVRGIAPQIGTECFIAPNATVVGEVTMGDFCSVWFNAVIRGDVNSIAIGHHTNIQDGAVIHCTYQRHKTVIGSYVSIAHNAIVHGCTIEDEVLIGMGAVVMDGALIKKNAIVAAGAIVLQNTVVEEGTIYGGNPARFLKKVSPEQAEIFLRTANNYVMYKEWFKNID